MDQCRSQVDGNHQQEQGQQGRPPAHVAHDEHGTQAADAGAIDVGGSHQARFGIGEAECGDQAIDNCRHDVDVEKTGGRQQGKQQVQPEAIMANHALSRCMILHLRRIHAASPSS